jgi:ubiquitin
MGGVKKLITGETPKPKEDKQLKAMQAEQLRLEKARAESSDRQLESSRRARLSGQGAGRSGLAYAGTPGTGTLG